jgi:hypothetical protein
LRSLPVMANFKISSRILKLILSIVRIKILLQFLDGDTKRFPCNVVSGTIAPSITPAFL